MKNLTRRTFIKSTLAASTAWVCCNSLPSKASDRPIGANERIRFGVAGLGIRGLGYMNTFSKIPNVQLVAVTDPDKTRCDAMQELCEQRLKTKPVAFQEYRKMLDMDDLDVVVIASSDHWHALMAIWACQAGKDIYLEKPCAKFIYEGQQIIAATKKYDRIVQHGTQRRTEVKSAIFCGAARSGKYGKPLAGRIYCNRPRGSIGIKPTTTPPATLNWSQWIGPAAMMDYRENIHPYEWHWLWNTGHGEIGNNGIHFFDLLRLTLRLGSPDSVVTFGNRFVPDPENNYRDQGETPNMMVAVYDFAGFPIIYQGSQLADKNTKWQPFQMTEIYTDQGVLRSDNLMFTPKDKDAKPVKITGDYEMPRRAGDFNDFTIDHIANFVDCVRSRKAEELNAPIDEGHRSVCVSLLGNASYRVGSPASTEEIEKAICIHPIAREAYDFTTSNLAAALPGLKNPQFILGSRLRFDGKTETCIDNPEANKLSKRDKCQAGFEIPAEV